MSLIQIFTVGIGGAAGAVLRYLTSVLVQKWFKGLSVYTGTLISNITGCFIAGVLLFIA